MEGSAKLHAGGGGVTEAVAPALLTEPLLAVVVDDDEPDAWGAPPADGGTVGALGAGGVEGAGVGVCAPEVPVGPGVTAPPQPA